MSPRLHALQGRANVECPKCGHALARHDGDRCAACVNHVRSEGYSVACTDAKMGVDGSCMRTPYTLCATREDDDREVCPIDGTTCDPGECELGAACEGPAALLRRAGGR